MIIFKHFLALALLICSAFAYEISDFKDSNVLILDEDNKTYYEVLAKSDFLFDESKAKKEQILMLKAKANLVNYLNEKNGEDFSYSFKNFLATSYFENGKIAGIIAKIEQKNIKKLDVIQNKLTFEEFIKQNLNEFNSSDIVRFEDDYYVLAFESKDINGFSPAKRVKAIQVTNTKAQKEFLAFIKGETFEVKTELKITNESKNAKNTQNEEFSEIIKTKANNYIKNYKTLSFNENGVYFYVVYEKI